MIFGRIRRQSERGEIECVSKREKRGSEKVRERERERDRYREIERGTERKTER